MRSRSPRTPTRYNAAMSFPVRAITLDLDDTLWPFAPTGARIEQALAVHGGLCRRDAGDRRRQRGGKQGRGQLAEA